MVCKYRKLACSRICVCEVRGMVEQEEFRGFELLYKCGQQLLIGIVAVGEEVCHPGAG